LSECSARATPPESNIKKPHPGGMPELSRWLSEAWRAIPPVTDIKRMHPGGMPETHDMRLWHPSGMRCLSAIISGGVARKASLNHRLSSGIPPGCIPPACIPPGCIPPACIPPACIPPACIPPACIPPAGIPPACILPACILPAGILPAGILPACPPYFAPSLCSAV
jgi:hypothetical protein